MSAGMLVGQPDALEVGWWNKRININNNNHCKQEQKQQWPSCRKTHSWGSLEDHGLYSGEWV